MNRIGPYVKGAERLASAAFSTSESDWGDGLGYLVAVASGALRRVHRNVGAVHEDVQREVVWGGEDDCADARGDGASSVDGLLTYRAQQRGREKLRLVETDTRE